MYRRMFVATADQVRPGSNMKPRIPRMNSAIPSTEKIVRNVLKPEENRFSFIQRHGPIGWDSGATSGASGMAVTSVLI